MASETLSVRLDSETRRLLDEEALARQSGGASSLAREILEHEVRALRSARVRAQIDTATATIATSPGINLWGDIDFFPAEKTP